MTWKQTQKFMNYEGYQFIFKNMIFSELCWLMDIKSMKSHNLIYSNECISEKIHWFIDFLIHKSIRNIHFHTGAKKLIFLSQKQCGKVVNCARLCKELISIYIDLFFLSFHCEECCSYQFSNNVHNLSTLWSEKVKFWNETEKI